jgi:hypothetical protein
VLLFPPFTERPVIVRLSQEPSILEQVEIDRETHLVSAGGMAIGALLAHLAMHTRVAVSVTQRDLITHLVGPFDEPTD